MPGQAKLIVLEGGDEVSLRARIDRLYRWLRGRGIAVEQTHEPTHGPVGTQIRLFQQGRLRLDPASLALLWVADRLDHLGREDGMLDWLRAGRHVLCARYLLFSYAAQLDELPLAWLQQINARCRAPDLTLFVDCGLRGEAARLEARYRRAVEQLREVDDRMVCVDGRGAVEETDRACRQHLAACLGIDLQVRRETDAA